MLECPRRSATTLGGTPPGVLRMDHDVGEHDDRAIALALAAAALVERGLAKATVSHAAFERLPTAREPERVTRAGWRLGLPLEGGRYYPPGTWS